MLENTTVPEANETEEHSEFLEIQDLDHFVYLLNGWHAQQVAELEHLLDIPEGAEVCLGDVEGITLSGETHTAFVIGLTLALMKLGELPFMSEYAGSDDDQLH